MEKKIIFLFSLKKHSMNLIVKNLFVLCGSLAPLLGGRLASLFLFPVADGLV